MNKQKIIGLTVTVLALSCAIWYVAQTALTKSSSGLQVPESETIVDNRTQISDPNQGQSVVLINNKDIESEYGTGYVVGKDSVITNRHVVMDAKPEQAIVRVGHKDKDGNVTFNEFKVKEFIFPEDETVDVACLKLEQNAEGKHITELVSPITFGDYKEIKLGSKLTLIGYPGDKEYATLWQGKGEVEMLEGTLIAFRVISAPGNSGSPLFNEKGQVVAMNNAGGDNNSFGFLIDENVLSFIQNNLD